MSELIEIHKELIKQNLKLFLVLTGKHARKMIEGVADGKVLTIISSLEEAKKFGN